MTEKIGVSVVIPVLDEEANLSQCLERLTEFSEIIVVDSGSRDATGLIALSHGAKLVQFKWDGGYPKKRNWVLLNVPLANPWVLFLDADEIVSDSFCAALRQSLATTSCNGFWLRYTNHFMTKPLRYGDPQKKLALFRVGAGLFERIEEAQWSSLDMEVHEHPIIDGEIGEIITPIDHRDDRGLSRLIDRHKNYALWEAQRTLALRNASNSVDWDRLTDRQKTKYRYIDMWWFSPLYFIWSYVFKFGFLDGHAGFCYAFFKMWYFWIIRLMIIEMRRATSAV